ncbi:MAG TPA: ABC transporter substrate-binding protein [Acidimicrobiales bacterium]|nr:ABC transporter substrate-binding protein [Acidimicrobiales bacterium]
MLFRRRIVVALVTSALAFPLLSLSGASASSPRRAPQCVVSLSPSATETLYAIGAGPQVRAVDKDSNYPTKGLPPASKRIDALNPSVESVIGICPRTATHPSTKPDLVIISYDANSIKEKLRALGIKVVEQDAPATLAGAYAQMRQLGALTGHARAAAKLVSHIATTITRDVASIAPHPKKVINVYYELDPTYYSLTSTTFVGSLLKSLGLVNIADAQSTSADAGYPQLNSEYIISSNPQLILLADTKCCQASAATLAQRPGFSSVSAVVHHHVVGLNDDVASRWGPRLAVLMNRLTDAVRTVLHDQSLWG